MNAIRPPRLWEIDALRGGAIVLMAAYHAVFDLDFFFHQPIDSQNGLWYAGGRVSAALFIALAGIASALIRRRYERGDYFRRQLKRGLQLIAWGLLITAVTLLAWPQQAIWFGTLHFLGCCVLLSAGLAGFKWLNLGLAGAALALGIWLEPLHWSGAWGIFLGAPPLGYQSLDYYPLFPCISLFLLGIALGNAAYPKGEPLIRRAPGSLGRILAWMGKGSLTIYLIHQPILLGLLWLALRMGK